MLASLVSRGFEVEFHGHAEAILSIDFPQALEELDHTLCGIALAVESLVRGGGGEHELTQGLRHKLATLGWQKHNFEIKKFIDGVERESISHEVDHVRNFDHGKVALEIEWNNKDPFFDRDLENFKRLHSEAAISVGIIVTRGTSLQDGLRAKVLQFAQSRNIQSFQDLIPFGVSPTARQDSLVSRLARNGRTFAEAWAEVFVSDKFGQATTHWRKLEDRIRRGVGNPCPLLLIGIPETVLTI
ncbi:restriction endonuclease [bacterium]|nr:MAG: restriction endonuclease [bacterium]